MEKKHPPENLDLEEFPISEEETEDEDESILPQDIVVVDGILKNDKVILKDPTAIQQLYDKSYFGTKTTENQLELEILEALLLLERKRLRIYTEQGQEITFEQLTTQTAKKIERVWTKYLIYRDLRQRGYIVRLGFGDGIDFRVFSRGSVHQDEIAKYFVCILAEGDPVQLETLDKITRQTITARKELVLAIIDRLGDPTYYKLEQFKLTLNEKGKNKW